MIETILLITGALVWALLILIGLVFVIPSLLFLIAWISKHEDRTNINNYLADIITKYVEYFIYPITDKLGIRA